MEILFIDSSIFIRENFLHGNKIKQILNFSANEFIKIVTTPITIGELKNNFRKRLIETDRLHKEFKKDHNTWSLHNTSVGKPIHQKLNVAELCKEFEEQLDKAFKICKIAVIDYSDINLKDVFEKYFNGIYPFHGENKKNEFPDAVILKLIENWCESNTKNCTILSTDPDFLKHKHPQLTIRNDIDKYVNEKLNEFETYRINTLEKIYKKKRNQWTKVVTDWVSEQLQVESTYYDYVNHYDVHNILDVKVELIEDNYNVVEIKPDDPMIRIEIDCKFRLQAKIETDDPEYMYYDSDDKSYHIFETKTLTIDTEKIVPFEFTIYISGEGLYDEDFELISTNNGEELEIESDDGPY